MTTMQFLSHFGFMQIGVDRNGMITSFNPHSFRAPWNLEWKGTFWWLHTILIPFQHHENWSGPHVVLIPFRHHAKFCGQEVYDDPIPFPYYMLVSGQLSDADRISTSSSYSLFGGVRSPMTWTPSNHEQSKAEWSPHLNHIPFQYHPSWRCQKPDEPYLNQIFSSPI